MRVRCVCGDFHEVSPTGLALVIAAFQSGDMQTIGHEGVQSVCLQTAFTNERIMQFTRMYPGKMIQFKKMGKG